MQRSNSDIPLKATIAYVQAREKLLLLEIEHPAIAKACGYNETISGILLAAELILGQGVADGERRPDVDGSALPSE